jgi:thioredoxin 1
MVTVVAAQVPGGPFQLEDEPSDSSQQIADRIIKSKKPVLIDFWAVWCAPCRILDPTIKKLEKEFKGKVDFIKVNVDVHRQISAYFRIQGIPAIYIVKDKAVQKAIVGMQPEATYRSALKEVLAKPSAVPPKEEKKPADSSASEKKPPENNPPKDSL